MSSVRYTLDAAATRLTARTGTVGMFSPFAHDLEIASRGARGEAQDEGGTFTAKLEVPTSQLGVAGVVKRGRVDAGVLSAKDRAEVERRMQEDVFRAVSTLVVEVRGTERGADVELRAGTGVLRVRAKLTRVSRDAQSARAEGELAFSMKALGLPEVRGPLNAFRVADEVQVHFDVAFRAAAG